MKRIFIAFFILLSIYSCKRGKNIPDVSNIKIDLNVQRFEQDFFKMDTLQMDKSLQQLSQKYPLFFGDFMTNIMGMELNGDSAMIITKRFIAAYTPIYVLVEKQFADLSKYTNEIKQGFQFIHYYFPKYKLPKNLITFIGPMNAYFNGSIGSYGDVLTQAGPAIGLQLHLGRDEQVYKSGMESGAVYEYQVKRFIPEAISVNVIKNIIDDIFPYDANDKTLVEQMIEKGKRLYILDQLMPYTADTLKIGYTKAQLDICNEHEAAIWDFFIKNNLLYSIEPEINKEYITDGPKTQVLGEGVPGYLGLYVGWQIVKKWMSENEKTTLKELMQKHPRVLFNEAKYKPKD